VEGCAFEVADNQKVALAFLYCFEGQQQSSMNAVEQCAKSAGIDYSALNMCASGVQGQSIDIKNAVKTTKLGSSKLGTPWLILNGVYVQNPMQLLSSVCEAITGEKPMGCNNL
jgi:hypothetical protein